MSSESKAETAYQSLTSILNNNIPPSSPSQDPASSLLHDPEIASRVSSLLRQPNSGAEDDSICRWLYDTFQSNDPKLQLVAISFLPVIAGVYLSRVTLCKPLAGFEAVLLALYAHETTHRNGQPVTVNVPDLSHPSIYHESKSPAAKNNNATDLNLAVISPSLEPHGTMRSTKRARIVGVTLELYYSKIPQIPVRSKIDFCEFCQAWAGQDGHDDDDDDDDDDDIDIDRTVVVGKEGRIPLPWELLQPVLRILGHCLLGSTNNKSEQLYEAACGASRSLYARALHDINPNAILATGSLLRLGKKNKKKNASDSQNDDDESEVDHTEIPRTRLISL